MDKQTARLSGLAARASLSAEQRRKYDRVLFGKLTALAEDAEHIGCYVSMGEEADTHAFLEWCFAKNKKVSVPICKNGTLTFHPITSFADLHPGCFGVMEPEDRDPVDLKQIDLMIIPLSSFDGECHRTGYGKGYYDSVLLPSMKKAGIAYPEQYVDFIETDPWDVTLDFVITPDDSE